MKREEAEKKKKFHEKRAAFYQKKIEQIDQESKRIGFKIPKPKK